jgi:hypothetical protein
LRFSLDLAVPYILNVVSISIPKMLLFGSIVGVYIHSERINIYRRKYPEGKQTFRPEVDKEAFDRRERKNR